MNTAMLELRVSFAVKAAEGQEQTGAHPEHAVHQVVERRARA
jgi:hypothetical protein